MRPIRVFTLVLFVAAVALRAWDLGRRSLWLDEAWAAIGALDGPFDVAHVRITPLLFAGLVRGSVTLLGRSEIAARLPALLFGVGAVVLVHRVGRRLLDPGGALLATAVVGLLPIPVYFSKELKAYSAELCLGLAVIALAARLRERPTATAGWVGLTLCVVLGCGLSAIAPVLAAGAFAALLPAARRVPLRYGTAVLASALATVAWLRLVFEPQIAGDPQVTAYWHLFYLHPEPLPRLAAAALRSGLEAATFGLGLGIPHVAESAYRFPSLPARVSAFVAAAMLVGAACLVRRGHGWFVVLVLVWHGLIAAAALAGRYPYGPARIALFFLGPTALLLGAGADAAARLAPRRVRPLVWIAATVPLLWPLAGTWRENVTQPFEREELRPVLQAVLARARQTDVLWVSPGATAAFRFYVPAPDARTVLADPLADAPALRTALVAAAGRGGGRVWTLFSHRGPVEEWLVRGSVGRLLVPGDAIRATGAEALLLVQPPPR